MCFRLKYANCPILPSFSEAKTKHFGVQKSISKLPKNASGHSGCARSLEAPDALSRSKLARSRSLINFRGPRGRFGRVSSLDPGPLSSILGRPDGPGRDFAGRNGSIFDCFRRAYAFGLTFVRSVQNCGRSYIFGTSELSRDKTKATKNRSEDAFDGAPHTTGVRTAHR